MTVVDDAREKLEKLMKVTTDVVGKKRGMYGDDPRLGLDIISTGVAPLDGILGNGGLQRGRMVMIHGEASMGKTLITQWIMKAFQDLELTVGFIDPEKTFESGWFGATGVDTSKVIVVRPVSTEQAFDLAGKWADAGMDLIVMDSLAALAPISRLEKDLADGGALGADARAINTGLKVLNAMNEKSVIIYTNQQREKIGGYGDPTTFPGGKGQLFTASYRLSVKRGGWIGGKDFDKREGYYVHIRTEKNKTSQPFKQCDVPFYFTGVIDVLAGLIDIALDLELIEQSGAWFTWEEQRFQGKKKLHEFFEENPDAEERLKNSISYDPIPDDNEIVEVTF